MDQKLLGLDVIRCGLRTINKWWKSGGEDVELIIISRICSDHVVSHIQSELMLPNTKFGNPTENLSEDGKDS